MDSNDEISIQELFKVYFKQETKRKLYRYFPEVNSLQLEYEKLRNSYRHTKNNKKLRKDHQVAIEKLTLQKEKAIDNAIHTLSSKINEKIQEKDFEWLFNATNGRYDTKTKKYYRLNDDVDTFFISNAIAYDIRQAYNSKTNQKLKSRTKIMTDLIGFLRTENEKMILIRTDITHFSENVDINIFLEIIKKNKSIHPYSIELIEKYAKNFYSYTGRTTGVARGTVLSSIIQEVLALKVEEELIQNYDEVLVCEHFGDDYFILLDSSKFKKTNSSFNLVNNVFKKFHLPINRKKTTIKGLGKNCNLEYLGYTINRSKKGIRIDLRNDYFYGVIAKINTVFKTYSRSPKSKFDEISLLLKLRIIFNNTMVIDYVNHIPKHLLGLSFSTPLLSPNSKVLLRLDRYYQLKLRFTKIPQNLRSAIKHYSISKSFKSSKVYKISYARFNKYCNEPILAVTGARASNISNNSK
jgi:hypothetical protein